MHSNMTRGFCLAMAAKGALTVNISFLCIKGKNKAIYGYVGPTLTAPCLLLLYYKMLISLFSNFCGRV